MLKTSKILAIRAARRLGLSSHLLNSNWRRERLSILCYHGTSHYDEHLWAPRLYITPVMLRERMQALKDLNCNVLPLDSAVKMLYRGTLPRRAVVITFDDGLYDFYALARPILEEFDYPATVYLTTYYSAYNRPIFDLMCSYLLWKARDNYLIWPEHGFDHLLLNASGRAHVEDALKLHSDALGMSGHDKDTLIEQLAARLNVDLEPIRKGRLIHLMNPCEVSAVARAGIDVQLHTHRHRSCRTQESFVDEISRNRRLVDEVVGRNARHFSYPGGVHLPEYPAWLREQGLTSATTCDARLATPGDDHMLLPRLVDSSGLSTAEFSAWVTGLTEFLPRRPHDRPQPFLSGPLAGQAQW
jgi:peptidoglycan/xylan/chitin deacetylase (PgdA/CDA1 family)